MCLGLWRAFFVLGFWAMAFCHWRFVPRSDNCENEVTVFSLRGTCIIVAVGPVSYNTMTMVEDFALAIHLLHQP